MTTKKQVTMLRLSSDRKQALEQIADGLKISKNAALELALDKFAQEVLEQHLGDS